MLGPTASGTLSVAMTVAACERLGTGLTELAACDPVLLVGLTSWPGSSSTSAAGCATCEVLAWTGPGCVSGGTSGAEVGVCLPLAAVDAERDLLTASSSSGCDVLVEATSTAGLRFKLSDSEVSAGTPSERRTIRFTRSGVNHLAAACTNVALLFV